MTRNIITPITSEIKTYYKFPLLDRLTARYTVEWVTKNKVQKIIVHNRFQDFERHYPSIKSIFALPKIIKTYFSYKKSPILKDPIPFLVIDAIQFLDTIVKPGMQVLELGAGNSTIFFLRKGANVLSIEHSQEWANYITKYIRDNKLVSQDKQFQLEVKADKNAISIIENLPDNSFDLILIDCANEYTRRNECIRIARRKIIKGGWMVLDNSDHPINRIGVDLMSDRKRIRFSGYAPMCLTVSQTSFWQM